MSLTGNCNSVGIGSTTIVAADSMVITGKWGLNCVIAAESAARVRIPSMEAGTPVDMWSAEFTSYNTVWPDFLRGHLSVFLNPDRLAIGGCDAKAAGSASPLIFPNGGGKRNQLLPDLQGRRRDRRFTEVHRLGKRVRRDGRNISRCIRFNSCSGTRA